MSKERQILENKVAEMLKKREQSIGAAMEHIGRTGQMIDDNIIPVNSLDFMDIGNSNGGGHIEAHFSDHRGDRIVNTIHDHAYGQIAGKFNIPTEYLRRMAKGDDWQRRVAINTLGEFANNDTRERFLMRSVDGQVRAVLSDKYRRLNSMKIFLTFLSAVQNTGSVLVDAHSGDTRNYMEVIQPEIIEFDTPLNGKNFAVFGARIRNSDFGHGALELRSFMMNVACMNGMVGQTMLREVHMGGSIPESFQVSEETVLKDTEARASLVKDAMNNIYTERNKEQIIETIKGASSKEIDVKLETEKLPKLGLNKSEVELFTTKLMNNNPEDGLTGSPTMWKFINGMTAVARDSEPERKRELEKIAGSLLGV